MLHLSRISVLSVFVGMCIAIAHPALAEDEVDYARTGPYIGATILGGSYLTINDQLAKDLLGSGIPSGQENVEQDPALGFDIYVGYRLHRYFAVEGEFEMLPSSDIDLREAGTLSEVESLTGTFNAKAFLPFGRFQPFVLVGVGVADIENQDVANLGVWVSDTEVVGRFGGGADFYLTEHVVAHFGAEYVLPGGNLSDFDYISYGAGIQYRF